jgi:N-acyl-D-aspartate/D-glutamate deacylase
MCQRIWTALLFSLSLIVPIASAQSDYDILIAGGTVIDGTGAERFRADVAVRGDRIVRVSREPIDADRASTVVDADGLIVAPGFIDQHAHIQTTIHLHPLAENFLRQGITTILASLHSGDQPYPLEEYMDSLRVAPNVGFFAGHTWARKTVVGLDDRDPTPAELEEMRTLVAEAMEDGALGLSTGLLYVPANYAKSAEVIELAKVAARYGGIYVSHMRNEAEGLLDSVAETIRVAREAGLPAQIQHHKAVGVPQWGLTERTLQMIEDARAEGLDVTLDVYPYTASSTTSRVLFPQWALAGGTDAFAERLRDPETRARIEEDMKSIFVNQRAGNDLSRVQFRTVAADPGYNGKTLADLARDRGLELTVDNGIDLVIELQLAGGFGAIYHSMDDEDVKRILRYEHAMINTDGDAVSFGVGHPHPRSYGTFPRVLGRYVRELGVLSLEEAIRRMTSLSAEQIGQADLGLIQEGKIADITVFDPETISDRATYTEPHQYSVGVRHVIINGVAAMKDGSLTGERSGRVIKGPARKE